MATLATLVVKLTADAAGFHSEMGKAESRTSKVLGGIGKSVQGLGTVALGGLGMVAGLRQLHLMSQYEQKVARLEEAIKRSREDLEELRQQQEALLPEPGR